MLSLMRRCGESVILKSGRQEFSIEVIDINRDKGRVKLHLKGRNQWIDKHDILAERIDGRTVTVKLKSIAGVQVNLSVQAPRSVRILREELCQK